MDITYLQNCKLDYDYKLPTYIEMSNYYDGLSDVVLNNIATGDDRANEKIQNSFVQKFVNEESSYCVANPINYISHSGDKEVVEDIRLNFKHWSEKHNKETLKQALIYSESYELYYVNKLGKFSVLILNPKNSYIVEDDFGDVQLLIRFFQTKFDTETQYADVYEGNTITHYTVSGSNFNQIGEIDINIFNRVPVSVCRIGTIMETIYGKIKDSQDGYENTISTSVSEILDFKNSYLVIEGCQLAEDELLLMKKLGIIQVPIGGKVSWLIKDLPSEYVNNTLTTIQNNIYMLASHIDHNEKLASNVSSLSLKNRLIGLQQKCTDNIQGMMNCIQLRLTFLFEYLKIKSNKDYSVTDLDVKFTPYLPSDDLLIAQLLSQYPKIPTKIGLSLFSFISNVDEAVKLLEEENQANNIGADLLTGGE